MTQVKVLRETRKGSMLEAKIIKEEHSPYVIEYYISGQFVNREEFPNKSIYFVEDAALNWIRGIKVLNG